MYNNYNCLTVWQFLASLNNLFSERRVKDHGSINLTQKRCIFFQPRVHDMHWQMAVVYGQDADVDSPEPTKDRSFPDLNPSKPLPILIRASNGKSKDRRDKSVKLSTIVEADALEGFFARYAEVCKQGMSGLKKRDRAAAKEKLKAKKKKQGGVSAGAEVKKS